MAFKEYMIKRKKTFADTVLTVLLYLAAFVIGMVVFAFLLPYNVGGIALLIIAGAFYGAHILSSRFNKEFEYIITDDNVDIDVIMNRSRRKRLISFSMEDAEIIASVKDPAYSEYQNRQYDKKIDATTGRKDADVYFAVVDKKGKNIVMFEPPYNALTMLGHFARSKVHIYE